jgi:hypothetical protein
MRAIRIAAITFATVFLSSAGSHADGTWCARVGDMGGAINCGFSSFEQCEAARSGNGGFCQRNPFTLGSAGSAYGYMRETRRYRRAH